MKWAGIVLIVALLPVVAQAGHVSGASAHETIARAKVAIARAAALDDQWTATIAALKAAQAAEQRHDYDAAASKAIQARMLADLSIKQAVAQKKLWRNEVVR